MSLELSPGIVFLIPALPIIYNLISQVLPHENFLSKLVKYRIPYLGEITGGGAFLCLTHLVLCIGSYLTLFIITSNRCLSS